MSSDEFVQLPCPACGGADAVEIGGNRGRAPGRWSGRCRGCGHRWTFDDD